MDPQQRAESQTSDPEGQRPKVTQYQGGLRPATSVLTTVLTFSSNHCFDQQQGQVLRKVKEPGKEVINWWVELAGFQFTAGQAPCAGSEDLPPPRHLPHSAFLELLLRNRAGMV